MRFSPLFPAIAIAAAMVLGNCNSAAADDRDTCKTARAMPRSRRARGRSNSKKYKSPKQKRVLSLLYTNRGVEYEIKKEYDKAIADHDQAIKIDPKNPAPYNNRGNAYVAKQDFEHAIADYDMAIKLNPKYAEAYLNRGMAKRNHGDMAGGESDIAQAKALQPGIGATQ